MRVGGVVESDTRHLGHRAQAWDGRWARGREGGVVKPQSIQQEYQPLGPRCVHRSAALSGLAQPELACG